MHRFFFNVRRGDMVFLDTVGELLGGLDEARGWARRDAQSLVDGADLEGDASSYYIEITDREGSCLASVPVVNGTKQ